MKYELFHHSPLAEFLLEKAVGNTRVVGHAFFWALKACLSRPKLPDSFDLDGEDAKAERKEKDKEQKRINKRIPSYLYCQERFFLMQERFLMCCGQFKNDIFKQNLVNQACINLSDYVNKILKNKDVSKKLAKKRMHEELKKHEIRIKMLQQLIIAHGRFDDWRYRKEDVGKA